MSKRTFSTDQLNTPDITAVTRSFMEDEQPAEKPKRKYTKTKTNIKTERLEFRTTKDVKEKLFKLAEAEGMSQSEYIEMLINKQAKKKGF